MAYRAQNVSCAVLFLQTEEENKKEMDDEPENFIASFLEMFAKDGLSFDGGIGSKFLGPFSLN